MPNKVLQERMVRPQEQNVEEALQKRFPSVYGAATENTTTPQANDQAAQKELSDFLSKSENATPENIRKHIEEKNYNIDAMA